MVDIEFQELRKIGGDRVAILGLANKPDVDDLCESPAIRIAELQQQGGITVKAFEPNKPGVQLESLPTENNLISIVQNTGAITVLVAHSQFSALKPEEITQHTSARLAIDIASVMDTSIWQNAGFEVRKFGAPNN